MLFVGVLLVFDGSLSAGVLIGVNMLIGKIFRPAQSIVEFPGEMKTLSSLLEPFAATSSLSTENKRAGNFHDVVGSVSFQEVSLSLNNGHTVLENVSYPINVHETIGDLS